MNRRRIALTLVATTATLPALAGCQAVDSVVDYFGPRPESRLLALADAADAVILITASKKDVQARAERLENIARAVVEIEFAQPSEQELEAVRKTFEEAEN